MLKYFQQHKHGHLPPTTPDFLFRYSKLQRILIKQSLDSLFVLCGSQSLHNPDSARIVAWLFQGKNGNTLNNQIQTDQCFSDFMMVLKIDCCHIYCSIQAHKIYGHFMLAIPNINLVTPTDLIADTPQEIDLLRIQFFYQAIDNLSKVGVPINEKQTKTIQKWPMIQSYALQQVGKGFFSQNHQVFGLSGKIANLFKNHDKRSLAQLITEKGAMLAGHVLGAASFFQIIQMKKKGLITQNKLNQVFQTAIQIHQQFACNGYSGVYFGLGTSTQKHSQAPAQVLQPIHFTIQYKDPMTSLTVGRTYFLTKNTKYFNQLQQLIVPQQETLINDLVYQFKQYQNPRYYQQQGLLRLYIAMIQGSMMALQGIAKQYKKLTAQYCKQAIWQRISKQKNAQFLKQNLIVNLICYNAQGQQVKIDFKDSIAFILTPYIYVLRVKLNNIIVQQKHIGGLLFCQSFALQQGCYIILTKQTQYIDFYQLDNKYSSKIQGMKHYPRFDQLGNPLSMDYEITQMIFPHKNPICTLNPFKCKIYFYPQGIRIHDNKLGWYLLKYKDFKNIRIISKNLKNQWLLFELQNPIIGVSLDYKNVLLQLKGKVFNYIFERLNPKKQIEPLSYQILDVLPQQIKMNYKLLLNLTGQDNTPIVNENNVLCHNQLLDFLQIKQQMILSSRKDFKFTQFLNLKKQQSLDAMTDKRKIVIISGGYGSGKNRLAQNLHRVDSNTSIFTIGHQITDKLSKMNYLDMLKQHSKNTDIIKTLLVVVPVWMPFKQLLQQMQNQYYIVNIVSKISTCCFYKNMNHSLSSKALSSSAPGYCQYIILDSFNQPQTQVSQLSTLVSKIYNQGKMIRVTNNVIHQQIAKQIISKPYFLTAYQQALRYKYEPFIVNNHKPQLMFVKFDLPVISSKLRKIFHRKLMMLNQGIIMNRSNIFNKLQQYKKQAQNSQDNLASTLYKLRLRISLKQAQKKSYDGIYQATCCGTAFMQRPIKGVKTIMDGQRPWYKGKIPELGMFVSGYNLNKQQLIDQLQSLTIKDDILTKIKPLKKREDVPQEILKKLSKQNKQQLDPNFFYYDGLHFRDRDAKLYVYHPDIQQYVKNYLAQINEGINKQNQIVSQQWKKYAKIMSNIKQ